MPGRNDDAALAANWKTILYVDALIGWAGLIVGLIAASRGWTVLGSLLVGAGVVYTITSLRRARRWRRIRAEAGLDS